MGGEDGVSVLGLTWRKLDWFQEAVGYYFLGMIPFFGFNMHSVPSALWKPVVPTE